MQILLSFLPPLRQGSASVPPCTERRRVIFVTDSCSFYFRVLLRGTMKYYGGVSLRMKGSVYDLLLLNEECVGLLRECLLKLLKCLLDIHLNHHGASKSLSAAADDPSNWSHCPSSIVEIRVFTTGCLFSHDQS